MSYGHAHFLSQKHKWLSEAYKEIEDDMGKQQIRHDQYDGCVMATATRQEGPPSEWVTFTVIATHITRLTEGRMVKIASALWEHMGRDLTVFHTAPHSEQLRWARMHMGRYRFVEIFTYDDETWGYRADSSGGGDWPLSTLKIVEGL